jgi:rubrerythrin
LEKESEEFLKNIISGAAILVASKILIDAFKKYRCPRCNYPLDGKEIYCPNCGQPIKRGFNL